MARQLYPRLPSTGDCADGVGASGGCGQAMRLELPRRIHQRGHTAWLIQWPAVPMANFCGSLCACMTWKGCSFLKDRQKAKWRSALSPWVGPGPKPAQSITQDNYSSTERDRQEQN